MPGKFASRNCYVDKIKIWSKPMSCLLRLVILFSLTVTTLIDLSAKPVGNNAPNMERTMQLIAINPVIPVLKDFSVETQTTLALLAVAGESMQVSTFSNPFNGKDLTGWGYLVKKQGSTVFESFDGKTESSDHRYSVQDGIITVHPFIEGCSPRYGKLYTKQEYPGDFIFTVEFRASVNADSGIFIRGKQLQCRDYLVAGPYKELKKYKPQDWNLIEIVVKNNVARCTCNGEVLEDAFVLPVTGPIGFESDRGQMEYRNLRINALTAK